MLNTLPLFMQYVRAKAARKREKGQGLTEFALILVLVVIVAITVLQALGVDITNAFQAVVDAL